MDAATSGNVIDSISYTITDGQGGTATASIDVTIDPAGSLGGNKNYEINSGTAFYAGRDSGLLDSIDIAEGTTLVAILAGTTTNGVLILNPDGSFVYKPDSGFTGNDTYSYEIQNNGSVIGSGIVTLAVSQMIATGETYSTEVNQSLLAGPSFVTTENPNPPSGLMSNDQFGTDGGPVQNW